MVRDLAVGVDLGATKMRACVGDGSGRLLRKVSRPVPHTEDPERFMDELIALVRSLLRGKFGVGRIRSVGVCAAGPLDIGRGETSPVNLQLKHLPLRKRLSDTLDRTVILLNDAQAGVLGEHLRGAGRGQGDHVYVTLSTGVGGGAVVDGRLLVGSDGNAVAAGHQVVDGEERLTCGCGRRGHWEAYCSGTNLPNFARLLAETLSPEKRPVVSGVPGRAMQEDFSAKSVFRAAESGDGLARLVVDRVGRLNAIGISNLAALFDPSLVTLGGALALENRPMVLEPILRYLGDFLPGRPPKVVVTPLGDDAGLIGALAAGANPDLVPRAVVD